MLHVFRHVNSLRAFRPLVLTQRLKGQWGGMAPVVVSKSPWRELGRFIEKASGRPWQMTSSERSAILHEITESRCRLLHVFFGNAAIHMMPLLENCPVPVVVSFHGSDVAGSMCTPGYKGHLRRMFAAATLVPCRSQHLADQVLALGCPQEKIRVMRAVLPQSISGNPRRPTDGGWVILQAGRMVPKKGMLTALRAFALFCEKYPIATFTIAGDGPMRKEIEALIGELGLSGSVSLPGFLDQNQLAGEFEKAHMYLHPSETVDADTEGVPNALLEAMALGIPPVATSHGGICEAVIDGESGILCPERDPAALGSALLRLAADSSLHESIGLGASRRVASVFSAEAGIAGVEALYSEAIGNFAAAR